MLDRENHVSRLRVLAERLSQHSQGAVTDILATALDANAHTMKLPRYLIAFEELVKRARLQLDEIVNNPSYSTYVQAIDSINAIFECLDMKADWSSYAAPFNARAMAHLETCEHAIAAQLTTAPPSGEIIEEALSDIQQAISSIQEADIEAEAKELLLEMLRDAENALSEYHLSGLTGLRHVVERMVGAYAFNKEVLDQEVLDQNKDNTAVDRAFKALGRFVLVAQMFHYVKALPGVNYIVEAAKSLAEKF
jgi:hypothetical protein